MKPLLTELLWLTFSLVLTVLLASLFLDWSFVSGRMNLHFHDTYLIISRWLVLTPVFCFITFILYFFKEKRKMFSRTIPNWIIILSGLTLLIALTILILTFSKFTNGWTMYPPLSGLGQSKQPERTTNPLAELITHSLITIQIVILPLLLYATYHMGTQQNRKKSVQ